MARRTSAPNMQRWIQVTAIAVSALVGAGTLVGFGYPLYRVPIAQEALDRRVTKVETTIEALTGRLSSLEQGQNSIRESQKNTEQSLLELIATTKSLHDTMLQTWRMAVQNEESAKSFKVYVDERLATFQDTQDRLHAIPTKNP